MISYYPQKNLDLIEITFYKSHQVEDREYQLKFSGKKVFIFIVMSNTTGSRCLILLYAPSPLVREEACSVTRLNNAYESGSVILNLFKFHHKKINILAGIQLFWESLLKKKKCEKLHVITLKGILGSFFGSQFLDFQVNLRNFNHEDKESWI